MINSAYPHLQIVGLVIIQQLQLQLKDAAIFLSYQMYLQNKFKWSANATQLIHWKVSQLANKCISQVDCQIISKFIHEWLPQSTNSVPHVMDQPKQSVTLPIAPSTSISKFGTTP